MFTIKTTISVDSRFSEILYSENNIQRYLEFFVRIFFKEKQFQRSLTQCKSIFQVHRGVIVLNRFRIGRLVFFFLVIVVIHAL